MADAKCPSREEIRAFLCDQLSASSAATVRAHLLECDHCETTVRELQRQDPLLGELRRIAKHAEPDSACPDDGDCRDAMDQVKSAVRDQLQRRADPVDPRDTTETAPLTGKRLNQYVLIERVGRGGMGEVYRALHLPLNRHVAVKVLPPRQQGEKDRLARFLRETQTQGAIDRHPHIAYATDAGEADGVYYLVMELVDGRDLSQLIEEMGGPLTVHDSCAMIRHVALALSYLHGRDVVHRDVKPANIVLSSEGAAKLLDLGLASLIRSHQGRLTDPSRIVGSLLYSAPEQVTDAGPIGPATDVYGLGATFYELLTGEPPLRLAADDAFVRTIVTQMPIPVRERRTDVPGHVDKLLESMLAKQPADRPSAADVAKLLQRHARGCDPRAPSPADPAAIRMPVAMGKTAVAARVASTGARKAHRSAARWIAAGCCLLLLPLLLVFGWHAMASRTAKHPSGLPAADTTLTRPPWPPGPVAFPGLIPTPARMPGLHGWQVDTVLPRSGAYQADWDPAGKFIAVPCDSGYVRVYELCDGQLRLRMMLPHGEPIYRVDWSWDGKRLVSVGVTAVLKIWQLGDGTAKLRASLNAHPRGETRVAWHPTNNTLATCGEDGMLKRWDDQGTLLSSSQMTEQPQRCIAWSPDGNSLMVGGVDGQLRLVTDTGTMDGRTVAEVGSSIQSLAWHPSEDLVAIGTGNAGIQIRATDGTLMQSFTATGNRASYVGWSPDGETLAVVASSTYTVDFSGRELTQEKTRQINAGHDEIAWNPADQSLVWCDWNGFRRLSHEASGEVSELTSRSDRRVLTVDWHPDGKTFATAGTDSMVRVWDRDGRRSRVVRAVGKGDVPAVAWSPNGLLLATCGGWGGADWTVRLWNHDDLSMAYAFPQPHTDAVLDVAWSHDSVFVATASDDQTVRLWNAVTRQPGPVLSRDQGKVWAVGWNGTQRLLASGGQDHTLRVWDVRDATDINRLNSPRVFQTPANWIHSIQWSPDNSQIAFAGFSSVTLKDVSTGLNKWAPAGGRHVSSLSWEPDGRRLACGKWGYLNAETGFLREVAMPYAVAFDPTGRLLATGDWCATVRVWDTQQDRLVWLAVLLTDNDSAVFSGAGELLNPEPRFDGQLTYILQDDQGCFRLATPSEFRSRFRL